MILGLKSLIQFHNIGVSKPLKNTHFNIQFLLLTLFLQYRLINCLTCDQLFAQLVHPEGHLPKSPLSKDLAATIKIYGCLRGVLLGHKRLLDQVNNLLFLAKIWDSLRLVFCVCWACVRSFWCKFLVFFCFFNLWIELILKIFCLLLLKENHLFGICCAFDFENRFFELDDVFLDRAKMKRFFRLGIGFQLFCTGVFVK